MIPKIILYDDDAEILYLCRFILEDCGYEVHSLQNCHRVLEDVAKLQPDLILMDLKMPGNNAGAAIGALKGNEATHHIPVLLFSAQPDIAEISRSVRADGYIEKPFSLKIFIDTINMHLFSRAIGGYFS